MTLSSKLSPAGLCAAALVAPARSGGGGPGLRSRDFERCEATMQSTARRITTARHSAGSPAA
ncbi:hypothetical protein SAMN02745121_06328 [Nannocystis exedens]|uniref:Uncharacterized protein n=1 Tax=Nannocystis exedens TaxID=54 RepID=A0A1I2EY57_9BACT|nr:hypothetical protein NAEX_02543 [Nannocystis exedens]SFE97729.1 hypothetical protein SAMN02745121_06328 [Nannocystis exedens]